MTTETLNISILIATANRPDQLAIALGGLARCQLPDVDIEVVVADNGDDETTERTCREADALLNVRYLAVPERGKTIALNRAVQVANGELFVFTDDDVEFDPAWLIELWRAARDETAHVLFGGRVTPVWPDGCPRRLQGSAFIAPLYTLVDRGDEPGPRAGFRPFGPNMAIRRSAFDRGLRFDPDLGPGSASGVTMGDETDIARQLEAMGETAVYVPTSEVFHRVRPDQLSLRWQLARGIRYGRLLTHLNGLPSGARLLGLPRWLYRDAVVGLASGAGFALLGKRQLAFDRLMTLAVSIGRSQNRGDRE